VVELGFYYQWGISRGISKLEGGIPPATPLLPIRLIAMLECIVCYDYEGLTGVSPRPPKKMHWGRTLIGGSDKRKGREAHTTG